MLYLFFFEITMIILKERTIESHKLRSYLNGIHTCTIYVCLKKEKEMTQVKIDERHQQTGTESKFGALTSPRELRPATSSSWNQSAQQPSTSGLTGLYIYIRLTFFTAFLTKICLPLCTNNNHTWRTGCMHQRMAVFEGFICKCLCWC